MSFTDTLSSASLIQIRQIKEMAELFGFESRNKYALFANGEEIGFAAEQGGDILGTIVRQFLGHWRRFEIVFLDKSQAPVMRAVHPFRFYFQKLEITAEGGDSLGALEQRFSILHKKFDVLDRLGSPIMSVQSPIWKIWTFPFQKNGRDVAVVRKKWSGLLKEALLDADNFELEILDTSIAPAERMLLIAAAVFVDLQYFENKAK